MKRFFALFLSLVMLLTLAAPVQASAEETLAQDLSGSKVVADSTGFSSISSLFDGKRYEGRTAEEAATLTLAHEGGIGSLYLTFGKSYGSYAVTNNDSGETVIVGKYGYVHDFLDLEALFGTVPLSVTLTFANGRARLYELQVFGPGQVPDSIQKWQQPADGKTDLVLFATHSDDDQLFFAGLLPYYAVERGYQVQVVYLTSHYNTAPFRIHEVLDGLWSVGITAYPVFGPYQDFGDASTVAGAFQKFAKQGHSKESMVGFVVEQLRRFKPHVAVAHDFNGEYGHAQHKVYAQLVADAVNVSFDPEAYPETVEAYGVWDVPKTYIHLYEENPIVMDWDKPMESFGGMTPYQVSRDLGFACHKSQSKWGSFFRGHDTCASIDDYNPSNYGLYRTTVGVDEAKNDMFENLHSYGELQAIAEEEARLKAEEEARLKAEEEARMKAEEEARLKAEEEERLKVEEEARRESEAAAATRQTEAPSSEAPGSVQSSIANLLQQLPPLWILGCAGGLVLVILLLLLLRRPKGGKYLKKSRK